MADGDPPISPPSPPFHVYGLKPSLSDLLDLQTYTVQGKDLQVILSDEKPHFYPSAQDLSTSELASLVEASPPTQDPVSKTIFSQALVSKAFSQNTAISLSSSSKPESFVHGLRFGNITVQDLAAPPPSASPPTTGSFLAASPSYPDVTGQVLNCTPQKPQAIGLSSKIIKHCSNLPQQTSTLSMVDDKPLPPAATSNNTASCLEVLQFPNAPKSVQKPLPHAATTNTTTSVTEVVKFPKDSKSVRGFGMQDFKKDSSLCPNKQAETAHVWIRVEGLPIYMFEEATLLAIANTIGTPICVDPLNINQVELNSARICVNLNVSGPFFGSLWIAIEDDGSNDILEGFWVQVVYEALSPHSGHVLRNRISRKGIQGVVTKVFDNLTQSVQSKVHKVFDCLPQPAQCSKGLGSLGFSGAQDVKGLEELPHAGEDIHDSLVAAHSQLNRDTIVEQVGGKVTTEITVFGCSDNDSTSAKLAADHMELVHTVKDTTHYAADAICEAVAEQSKAAVAAIKVDLPIPVVVERPRKEWVCSTAGFKPTVVTMRRNEWVCSTTSFKPTVQIFARQWKEWVPETADSKQVVQQIVDKLHPNIQDGAGKMEYTEGPGSDSDLQPTVKEGKKGMIQKNPGDGSQNSVASDKQNRSQVTEKREKVHGDQQKLYIKQISKHQRTRKWIQFSSVNVGSRYTISTPLQQQDKVRYTDMRSQGHPFDDKG